MLGLPRFFDVLEWWHIPIFLLLVGMCGWELYSAAQHGVLKWRWHTYREDATPLLFWIMVTTSCLGFLVGAGGLLWMIMDLGGA